MLDMVLDQQELYSPLGSELRKKVRETLLKQHHHQNQKKLANRLPIVRSIADMGRRTSELHLDKNGDTSAFAVFFIALPLILCTVALDLCSRLGVYNY